MVEVGREKEFIGYRLKDIVFIAEKTRPVEGHSWESYAKSCLRLIADEARQAERYLSAMPDKS